MFCSHRELVFEAVSSVLDVALAYHGGGRLKEITPHDVMLMEEGCGILCSL